MGDLVDNGQDEYQWQAWMRSMKGIMDTIPGAVIWGNHEDILLLKWQNRTDIWLIFICRIMEMLIIKTISTHFDGEMYILPYWIHSLMN